MKRSPSHYTTAPKRDKIPHKKNRNLLANIVELRFNKLRFRFALSLCAFHFALLSKKRFISIFVSSYETAV